MKRTRGTPIKRTRNTPQPEIKPRNPTMNASDTDWSEIVMEPAGTPHPDDPDYNMMRWDRRAPAKPTMAENVIARRIILQTVRQIFAEQEGKEI